jgi:hypothetical protein
VAWVVTVDYCRREECNRQRCPSAGSCILAGGAGGESQSENQASPYPYLSGIAMSLGFVDFKIEYVGHSPDDAYLLHNLGFMLPATSRRPRTKMDAFLMTAGAWNKVTGPWPCQPRMSGSLPLHLLCPLSSTPQSLA